jgi:hypothetical protein
MPALFLGGVRLQGGASVVTLDLKDLPPVSDRRVVGILGMDALWHYCVQVDFAAGRMRFLNPAQPDIASWGRAFPIMDLNAKDGRPSVAGNLLGAEGPHSLIDSGYISADGWLMTENYKAWTNQTAAAQPGEARSPIARFFGEAYPKIDLDEHNVESDGIGLSFLARHLVTLDFPRRTLYLKRVSEGPLPGPNVRAATEYVRALKNAGKLPGWSKDDHGTPRAKLGPTRNAVTVEAAKNGESDVYHYQVVIKPDDGGWRLQKAWRTSEAGQTLEEYSAP